MSADPLISTRGEWRTVLGRTTRWTGMILGTGVSAALTGWLVGASVSELAGNRMAPWILGRAAGLASYVLLTALVALGLVLSHPWRTRFPLGHPATRLRTHVALAAATAVLTVGHIVVLATDPYAGVGWAGALLPMQATYRPAAVTLGLLGLAAGLAAGGTAALAGRIAARVWWPVHKVAAASFVLVWAHAVLAGSDTPGLRAFYLITGAGLGVLAATRYLARRPGEALAERR